MAESAVLDVDVDVEVAGSNPADRQLLEGSILGLLADGDNLVGTHSGCSCKIRALVSDYCRVNNTISNEL